jgi:hypothetical protein
MDSGTVVLGVGVGRPVASVLPANISTRITVIRQSAEGPYGVCGDMQSRMPVVLLDGASIDGPLVFVISHTADTQGRLNAVKRFLSLQRGQALPDNRITPQRRQRFRQLLRTVDARSCRASHRDIAAAFFGRHRISGPDWHESSQRYTIIRLVQDGVKLVRGRYRDILRHRGKA